MRRALLGSALSGDFGDVRHAELDAGLALVVADRQRAGEVQWPVRACTEDRLAQRIVGTAEGDGLEAAAVVGRQREADVAAGADAFGGLRLVGGEGKDRLRIAGTERPCPLDVLD